MWARVKSVACEPARRSYLDWVADYCESCNGLARFTHEDLRDGLARRDCERWPNLDLHDGLALRETSFKFVGNVITPAMGVQSIAATRIGPL